MLGAIIDDCPYPSSRSKNFGSNKEGPTIYHLPPNQQQPQKRSQTQADFWNNKMISDLLDSPFGNNQGGVGFTTISLNDEENNNNNNAVVPTWPSDDSPITVRSGRRCSVLLFPTLLVLFTIAAAVFNHNSSGSTIVTSPEMPVSWDDDYEMILSSDKKEEVLDDIDIIEQQLDSLSGAASQDDDSIELEKEALEDTEEELIGEAIEKEVLSGGSLDVDDDEVIVEDIEKEVEGMFFSFSACDMCTENVT